MTFKEANLKCPSVDEWIKKLWHIYTMEFYMAVQKEETYLVTVWMDLENILLSEISQSEKDKISHGLTHMWNLMDE